MKRWTFLLVLLLALPAEASQTGPGRLSLDGQFQQGGLVFGTTEPGAEVRLGGRAVRVSPDGRFVIGFGRDHKPGARLSVVFPDGSRQDRELRIAAREYRVQRIDGLPPKKVTPPESVWKRIKAENAEIAKVRKIDRPEALFESGFEWPAIGRISGVYGSQRILNGKPRRPHFGIDIAAPKGTVVRAPADGVVSLVHEDMYYTGGTIILDHGHGLTSAFLHLEDLLVEEGQRVTRGTPIATVGSTGRSTGPHLDWRINWFKERVDPALLVGPMPEGS